MNLGRWNPWQGDRECADTLSKKKWAFAETTPKKEKLLHRVPQRSKEGFLFFLNHFHTEKMRSREGAFTFMNLLLLQRIRFLFLFLFFFYTQIETLLPDSPRGEGKSNGHKDNYHKSVDIDQNDHKRTSRQRRGKARCLKPQRGIEPIGRCGGATGI